MKIVTEREKFLEKEFDVKLTGLELLMLLGAYGATNKGGITQVLRGNGIKESHIDKVNEVDTSSYYNDFRNSVKDVMEG